MIRFQTKIDGILVPYNIRLSPLEYAFVSFIRIILNKELASVTEGYRRSHHILPGLISNNYLYVIVYRLNAKLRPTGLKILNVRDRFLGKKWKMQMIYLQKKQVK
jgi:hypothetical protein